MINIGKRLKFLRNEKNLTRQEVADEVGLTIESITSHETGQRMPSYESLIALSRFYGVSTDYLLGESENRILSTTHLSPDERQLVSQLVYTFELTRRQGDKK